jgi:hypothetical protein
MGKTTHEAAAAPAAGTAAAAAGAGAGEYLIVAHAINPGLSRLKSAALDPAMHPGGGDAGAGAGAPIYIENSPGEEDTPEGATSIDSFQLASIEQYVREQPAIRDAMERGVAEYMGRNYTKLKLKPGPSFWKKVKVYGVHFPRKAVMTRERINAMKGFAPKLDEAMFKKMAAGGDQAGTRTKFQVFVRGPWENEHEHFGLFRNGRFVEFAFQ